MLFKINIDAFILGYKNIAQCFSCGNKIPWEEDWNPLDEVFHNKCEHLRQITSTQVMHSTSNTNKKTFF